MEALFHLRVYLKIQQLQGEVREILMKEIPKSIKIRNRVALLLKMNAFWRYSQKWMKKLSRVWIKMNQRLLLNFWRRRKNTWRNYSNSIRIPRPKKRVVRQEITQAQLVILISKRCLINHLRGLQNLDQNTEEVILTTTRAILVEARVKTLNLWIN